MSTTQASEPDGAVSLMPRHVGVVMDGNRRWARRARLSSASEGHRRGADHIEDLLRWCDDRRIEHLTVYVLSADNIRKRSSAEIGFLFGLVTDVLPTLITRAGTWSLHVTGDTGLLPERAAESLRRAEEQTADRPSHLTLAIGYDGREDIVAGIRRAVREGALDPLHELEPDAITSRLSGGPVKEIDLVIRTSGEQRLSGFCPWQTAHAEVHVSDRLWPDFGEQDFDAALAQFHAASERARRHG
ncbi:short-chain Z-isoprenyl diphosphate synthase [Nocardioides alpinus]|uniref:Isoprenyl transferase n=1 Tax=Nocardioides alpinus TaxID=748909 RepID=A0A1I1A804_9ACTN|nr:polyprenyl diphosphate synthase [Nocardioides alpinus]PKH43390.1 di-trans,poly-cis-decaprenylcistransferase [Nocardioides alpinus]SFB34071.1 short-chain Z-isoprenyl diphosphate synthase [Nocardioides alpinus]